LLNINSFQGLGQKLDSRVKHADERITELEKNLIPRCASDCRIWPINTNAISRLRASWASYGGHFKHASSYRTLRLLWSRHLISQFYLRLSRSFTPRFANFKYDYSWYQQIQRLSLGTKGAILMVLVGSYVECPRSRDQKLLALLPLAHKKGRIKAGVPKRLFYALVKKALSMGHSVAFATQHRAKVYSLALRELVCFYEPIKKQNFSNS
jgi:hypothetical protein